MALNDDIETLFKANYAGMHRLATMMLHDCEAAHDIVHDVFVSILDNNTAISFDSTYLMTSVRNRCMNRLKAIDVRDRFRELYMIENNEFDDIADWSCEDTLALLEKCESLLPAKCAEIFKLRFHDGMKAKEISKALGIGERMIYKHLHKALQILKQNLNGES